MIVSKEQWVNSSAVSIKANAIVKKFNYFPNELRFLNLAQLLRCLDGTLGSKMDAGDLVAPRHRSKNTFIKTNFIITCWVSYALPTPAKHGSVFSIMPHETFPTDYHAKFSRAAFGMGPRESSPTTATSNRRATPESPLLPPVQITSTHTRTWTPMGEA